MKVEAVIFDFDGTLVDLNINFGAMRAAVATFMLDCAIDPATLSRSYVLEIIDEATSLITAQNPSEGQIFYRKAMAIVSQCELSAAKKGKILPGVTRMLQHLREQRIKVGIITRNCDEAVKIIFPHIEQLCDVFLPRNRVTRVKPHPDHLSQALGAMAIQNPASCVMVGDHLLDIEAGRRIGMMTAGVLTGRMTRQHFIEAGADCILDDATKITDHIFQERAP